MTPVFPYSISRSEDGWRGELLLRLRNGKSAYVVHLSLEQARTLAVEMRGLATDHCPLHHMAIRIAEGLNAQVSHVVIKPLGKGDEVTGVLRMVTPTGLQAIPVDAAAGLALAIHMGIPIFMDGEFSPADQGKVGHSHVVHGMRIDDELGEATSEVHAERPSGVPTPIPPAFQELIEGLQLPDGSEGTDGRTKPDTDI